MLDPLVRWSKKMHQGLPWRKNRTLFNTLVSEIMLQQTTVATVQNHFEKFLKIFPTIKSLAHATEEEVLIAWKGLGYYKRAKNLKKACEDIENLHGGEIPMDIQKLKAISGIGDYTANAIISIGADKRGLPIDVNIARVLSRLYGIKESKRESLFKILKEGFHQKTILSGIKNYRETYEALMDLGRIFCRSKNVECTLCPIRPSCQAYKRGKPLDYPSLKQEVKTFYKLDLLRVLVCQGNYFLGERRREGLWLSQQIEVPTFVIRSEDKFLKQYPILTRNIDLTKAVSFRTSITKYKITNYVITVSQRKLKQISQTNYKRFLLSETKENISTASLKSLKKASYL